jgi:hypothetical protein
MKREAEAKEPSRQSSLQLSQAKDSAAARPVPTGPPTSRDDLAQQSNIGDQARGPSSSSRQDEIVTPGPLTVKPMYQRDQPIRTSRSLRLVIVLCLLISLISLLLSGMLAFRLLEVRRAFHDGLGAAIQAIDSFEGAGLQYEYQFEREIPVSAAIPIEQELVFPFEGEIPINTTVEVPIDAGILGTFNLEVPINTSVYVDTAVPVKVEQMFEVSTTVPISMTVPIDIRPDDPAIQDLLGQVRSWLIQLQQPF